MSRKSKPRKSLATRSVRAGIESDTQHGSVVPPIYLSTNFAFEGYRQPRRYDYTRSGNPTRDQLAAALADLEGGAGAVVTCTGLSAITLILATLAHGARILAPYDCYGGTYRMLAALHEQGKLTVDFVDQSDAAALRAALAARPKLVWIETPSNPLLRIVDISALATAAHEVGALVVVDNTFLVAALAAASRARCGPRDAFDDEIFERPQRCGRRRGDCRHARAARKHRVVGELHRRHGRAVRQLPDPAGRAHLARAHACSCREYRGGRRCAEPARSGAAGILSGPAGSSGP